MGTSAKDVRLVEKGRVLEGKLKRDDGTWREARVNLDEMIVNEDGELRLRDGVSSNSFVSW